MITKWQGTCWRHAAGITPDSMAAPPSVYIRQIELLLHLQISTIRPVRLVLVLYIVSGLYIRNR